MTFWRLFCYFFESQNPPKSQKLFEIALREPPRRSINFLGIQFFFLQKNPTELTKFLVSSAGPSRVLARGARKFVNCLEPVTNKKSQGP